MFHTDAGPTPLRAVSEFSFVHLLRTGQTAEFQRRLDRVRAAGRNCVRVFARAVNLFDLNEHQSGYWAAMDDCIRRCNAVGVYVHLVILVDVNGIGDSERSNFYKNVVSSYRHEPGVLFAMTNEPYQNGYTDALDGRLLDLADWTIQTLGHRDFIIGDARDGDDPDASAETIEQSRRLATYVNIIVLHSSRKGGANVGSDGRLRRWVDHLEGFYDVIDACRDVNVHAVGYHEEPMGHASQQWVPLPNGQTYEREYDRDCAIAAAVTSEFCGLAYCYHYISEQDDGTPGLLELAAILAPFPAGWSYRNDSWLGSPTHGFTWQGGKVRSYVGPPNGGTLAYGTQAGDVTWANGYEPQAPLLWDGPKAKVAKVQQW